MSLELNFLLARFDELSNLHLYQLMKLRSDVFVVEQNCVYPDLDNKDIHEEALHLLAFDSSDGEPEVIAYARCLPPGVSYEGASIGRVAVAEALRGKGLAKELMLRAIIECRQMWPNTAIQIGAQVYLQRFYEMLGFIATSDPYDEDGIMHIDMQLNGMN